MMLANGRRFSILMAISGLLGFVFIFFLFCSLFSLTKFLHNKADFASAQSTSWPVAQAQFVDTLTLGQLKPAAAQTMGFQRVLYPSLYHYVVQNKTCTETRFDFDHSDGQIAIAPEDMRVDLFIKTHCNSPPKTSEHDLAVLDEYTCTAFPIHYNPNNVCTSYIAKPLNEGNTTRLLATELRDEESVVWFNGLGAFVCFAIFIGLVRRAKTPSDAIKME